MSWQTWATCGQKARSADIESNFAIIKETSMAKSVAIIGAGISGLASIKAALEAGLEPTAYERDSWLGGIWRYTEDDRFCIQKSTILNTSKHFTCFSDYPIPKHMPNYLPADLYQRYLEACAEEFQLTQRIRFNHNILEVKKCEDYAVTGRWEVHSVGKSSEVRVEVYDFVMVCAGVYNDPYVPDIPSIKDFTGEQFHSAKYKTFKGFEGKRVLVVGLGNTAGDIACELSRHAAQVYISTRRGSWILPRLTTGGRPVDVLGLCRSINSLPQLILGWLFQRKLESFYNLANFGLEPVDSPTVQLPTINDELPHRIIVGSIIIKTEIDYFKNKQVFFKDGTCIDDIDTVIFATGFDVKYPFLPKSIFKSNQSHQFYKAVFPPELSKPSLAFIGGFRVKSAVLPICEMQARWAVQVFNGYRILPSQQEMKEDILALRYHDKMEKFGKANNTQLLLKQSYISYMDDVASLVGVKPNLLKMLLEDPRLAVKCFFGPCIPAQYRLVGPHSWSGARKVIEEVEESILTPLKTRVVQHPQSSKSSGRFFYWMLLALFVLLIGVFLNNN